MARNINIHGVNHDAEHHRHDGKAVEAVGKVHGVGRGKKDHPGKDKVEHAEIRHDLLEEGHGKLAGIGRLKKQQAYGQNRYDEQAQHLGARSKALIGVSVDFGIVIHKTHHAETKENEHGQPHIDVRQVCPKQGGRNSPGHDKQTAHGRSAGFGHMLRHIFKYGLPQLQFSEFFQEPGAGEDSEEKGEDERARRAEGDVAENVQQRDILTEGYEYIIQHGYSVLQKD